MSNLSNLSITKTFNGDVAATNKVNAADLDTQLGNIASSLNAHKAAIDTFTDGSNNLAPQSVGFTQLRPELATALGSGTGWQPKIDVACATTANISLSGEQTIDGVLTSSSRVLVKDQTTASQNGIYVSSSGAWSRAVDADTGAELVYATVRVGGGTTHNAQQWICTNGTAPTLGTTSITWTQGGFTASDAMQPVVAASTLSSAMSTLGISTAMQPVVGSVTTALARAAMGPWSDALVTATGSSAARTMAARAADVVNVKDFGAVGDNSTDDTAAFQAAFTLCASTGRALYIPYGLYLLSAQLTTSVAFDIYSDRAARLRWSTSSCGIHYNLATVNLGLCRVCLPQMYGPAINSTFDIPGYGPSTYTYSLASRVGDAFKLTNGSRITVDIQHAVGWSAGVHLNSAVGMANIDVLVNTMDFLVYGVRLSSTGGSFVAIKWEANTIWAKFPVYLDPVSSFVNSSSFFIRGQAFINEDGGCGIYKASGSAGAVECCSFDINWLSAGYSSDSTTGVTATLQSPYVGGTASSNGLTTDGSQPVGYFDGNYCKIDIGAVLGTPAGSYPYIGNFPVAGRSIRIKDAGLYNAIHVKNAEQAANTVALSTTQGEANFNGGVGGAPFSRVMVATITLAAPLANGAGTVAYYFYNQLLSDAGVRSIKVMNRAVNLTALAQDNSASVNREGIIYFANYTGASISAGTYTVTIEIN